MRTTSGNTATQSVSPGSAQDYRLRGWMVAETCNGVSLITSDQVCGIEVAGDLAAGVAAFLRANKLAGPVIALPGSERREIHLATGVAKAGMAIEALRAMGAIVHLDGAGIPLPPTQLVAGSATWAIGPEAEHKLPPVVAVAAAVRAISSGRPSRAAQRVAS